MAEEQEDEPDDIEGRVTQLEGDVEDFQAWKKDVEEKYAIVRGAEHLWDHIGGEVGRYRFMNRAGDHWRPPKEVFWRLAQRGDFDFTCPLEYPSPRPESVNG